MELEAWHRSRESVYCECRTSLLGKLWKRMDHSGHVLVSAKGLLSDVLGVIWESLHHTLYYFKVEL